VSVKRDKDVLLVSTTQGAPKNLPPAMAEAMKGMGLLSQTMAMLAKPGNFFFATGKDAAARVRQLVSAEPRKPTGLAATAVEESAGADGFFYMDFGQLVKLGAGAMGAGKTRCFPACACRFGFPTGVASRQPWRCVCPWSSRAGWRPSPPC
jgi:hypothetical protein